MRRRKNTDLKKYYKINIASSMIWILVGAGIVGFGFYYKEILEKIFGAFAILIGIISIPSKRKPRLIKSYEDRRIFVLAGLLVIYSLVNPLGNIAIIFDLFKRDFALRRNFDEKA
ncbi:hypothetical protein [uncultured Anaerococcus sp.]|uniref:hypothetical protein n=1 Tax=uncultured Anaerococcus sp. TaxID=293428 RepID=UPI00288B3E8E|nr:hypothetical protein [uncultured Anaerococcus sp.]